MSTQTFTSLYDTYEDAAHTVGELEAAGIPAHAISMVAKSTDSSEDAPSGAGTGASIGTVLGGGAGLLAGLGMVTIPGIGSVVAAGWLVSTLVGAAAGAAAGAATGGLIGAMTDAGVSAEDAHVYAEGVRRGGTLVTIRVPESQEILVGNILRRHGPVDTAQRSTDYRSSGWREFDIESPVLTEEELERERARRRDDRVA